MKAVNYMMACFFGIIGVVCALVTIDTSHIEWGGVALMCFILAWVAWGDYKRCRDDEDTL